MILFFILILFVYSMLNSYIIFRGWQFLSTIFPGANKKVYLVTMVLISLLYIIGMLLLRGNYSNFSKIFLGIGVSWFVILVYGILFLIGIDLLRIIGHFIQPMNKFFQLNSKSLIILGGSSFIFLLVGVFAIGNKIATTPKITTYKVDIQKKSQNISSMKIAFISDLHLGVVIGRDRLKIMIDKANSIKPDLVLLGGDIIDGEGSPFINGKMGEEFKRLNPRFGVYGVLGNHEYFGSSVEENVKALKESNINMLIDEKVLVNNSFYILGRNDRSGRMAPNQNRKSIKDIMEGIDSSKPIILLDHQPFGLEEAATNFVDLQLSGHTHNGQFWPISLITKGIYELDWGQKIKDKTNIIVSCGLGTWGPQIRLGSYSEVVEINVNFVEK